MKEKDMLSLVARKGAELGTCGKMCTDCAFKTGTDANNDESAVAAAMECLLGDATFNCHTSLLQNAEIPCVGFQYAKQFLNHLDNKTPEQEAGIL